MSVIVNLDNSRKKALGQYFSGRRVGRLLAALAQADIARRIIDPMVGSGDLLASCVEVGASPLSLVGFDLDPIAVEQAERALDGLSGVSLSVANAFEASYPEDPFDLVITNPPYIRYQSQGGVDGIDIPLAGQVRDGLIRLIQFRPGLDYDYRAALLRAAKRYPGTADLAVPSWILSAALVADRGALAVVAPQAWLTRSYAQAVRELLDEAFDVEYIVEDGDASWFNEAQVRTQLVVARRNQTRRASTVIMARATRSIDTDGYFRGDFLDELGVAAALRKVRGATPQVVTRGLTAHREIAGRMAARDGAGHIPVRVQAVLGSVSEQPLIRSLESYGWRAGQGLRTGANDFFYLQAEAGGARTGMRWGCELLPIPEECLLPVVRRQSDLGDALDVVDGSALPSRALYLRGWATPSDIRATGAKAASLSAAVSRWISRVEVAPLNDRTGARLFPELAAVAPNVRRDRSGKQTGFWYQLPSLTPRHRPAMFMARVCGSSPTAYANTSGAVVDANFSTLWMVEEDALEVSALLALLHSSWVLANLEANCTVLGGGALKVEAADLRRLALPDLDDEHRGLLASLGTRLMSEGRSRETQKAIDLLVVDALGMRDIQGASTVIEQLAGELLEQRAAR
ncbi:N-6 DNA methylase [Plantibacter sp. MCCC 1A11337]|nr:N-6 DNA methylase [Plantibacter sp. MCCC 1A11337]